MACWTLITQLIAGTIRLPEGMKLWIPCLFYGSWFLWALAAFAATRSYQLHTSNLDNGIINVSDEVESINSNNS
jgi:hypothetical protein